MKSYKETKAAVKCLILKKRGIYNIYNLDLSILYEQGHNVTNVQNALDYFKYSPQAKSFMDKVAAMQGLRPLPVNEYTTVTGRLLNLC